MTTVRQIAEQDSMFQQDFLALIPEDIINMELMPGNLHLLAKKIDIIGLDKIVELAKFHNWNPHKFIMPDKYQLSDEEKKELKKIKGRRLDEIEDEQEFCLVQQLYFLMNISSSILQHN